MQVRQKSSTMLLYLGLASLSKHETKTIASEDLLCLKVNLLQSLSTLKQADILRSGILIWGVKFHLQSPVAPTSC